MGIHDEPTAGVGVVGGLDLVGTTIDGYSLERLIGKGGAGVVYRARQLSLGRQVAFKMVHPETGDGLDSKQRFARERRVHLRLSHPNLVSFLDQGQFEEQAYLVMELVEGGSLDERMARGPFPLKEAIDILRQLAQGLSYLHMHDIVHRDLKPGNVLLGDGGLCKISDFGLARGRDMTAITAQGELMGTLGFIAPEVFLGVPATPLSDAYSLGAIFYQLLVRRPHIAETAILEHFDRCLNEDPVPPRRIDPEIPEWVSSLAMRLLSRTAADRPDAGQVLQMLERHEQDALARSPSRRPGKDASPKTLHLGSKSPATVWRPGWIACVLVALLIGLASLLRAPALSRFHDGIEVEVHEAGLRFRWTDGSLDPIQLGRFSESGYTRGPLVPDAVASLDPPGPRPAPGTGSLPILLELPEAGRMPLDLVEPAFASSVEMQYLRLRSTSPALDRWRAEILVEPGARSQWLEGRRKGEEVIFEPARVPSDALALTLNRLEARGALTARDAAGRPPVSLTFRRILNRTVRTERWLDEQLSRVIPDGKAEGQGTVETFSRRLCQTFGLPDAPLDAGWIRAARQRLEARFADPDLGGPERRALARWLHALARLLLTSSGEEIPGFEDLRALARTAAPLSIGPLPEPFDVERLDLGRARLLLPPDANRTVEIAGFGSLETFGSALLDPPEGRPGFWLSLAKSQPEDHGSMDLGIPAASGIRGEQPAILELMVWNLGARSMLEVSLMGSEGQVLESVPLAGEKGIPHPGDPDLTRLEYPANPSSWKNLRACSATLRVTFFPRALDEVARVRLECPSHPRSAGAALDRIVGILGWRWVSSAEVSP